MSIHILSDIDGIIRIRIASNGRTNSYEIDPSGQWKAFYYYDYGVSLEGPPFEGIKDLLRFEIQNRQSDINRLKSEIVTLERLIDRIH